MPTKTKTKKKIDEKKPAKKKESKVKKVKAQGVEQQTEKRSGTKKISVKKKHRKHFNFIQRLTVRISDAEKIMVAKHLAVLLGAGLPIAEAVKCLKEESKGASNKILTAVSCSIQQGKSLANAFSEFAYIFGPVFTNLIKAGEESGTLKNNLTHLSVQLKKQHELKQKVRGAMVYPFVVFTSALVIAAGIVIFVLPNVVSLFKALKVDLPISTKMLLWMAVFFQEHGFLVVVGSIVVIVLALVIRHFKYVRYVTHWLSLMMPITGKIARDINIAQITRLLGTLLKSGMALDDALTATKPVVKNYWYKEMLEDIQKSIAQGSTITVELEKHQRIVPPITLQLVHVGEESGTLDDMFLYLAEFYEEEIDNSTRLLTTLLEPIMILFIGIMIAVLAFSIITPIYKIVGTI